MAVILTSSVYIWSRFQILISNLVINLHQLHKDDKYSYATIFQFLNLKMDL